MAGREIIVEMKLIAKEALKAEALRTLRVRERVIASIATTSRKIIKSPDRNMVKLKRQLLMVGNSTFLN